MEVTSDFLVHIAIILLRRFFGITLLQTHISLNLTHLCMCNLKRDNLSQLW